MVPDFCLVDLKCKMGLTTVSVSISSIFKCNVAVNVLFKGPLVDQGTTVGLTSLKCLCQYPLSLPADGVKAPEHSYQRPLVDQEITKEGTYLTKVCVSISSISPCRWSNGG